MNKKVLAAVIALALVAHAYGAAPADEGPELQFTAAGKLVPPAGYRQWPLIGTGLGMKKVPDQF
jgi:hypothetical protein